jgi:hypothetical protein
MFSNRIMTGERDSRFTLGVNSDLIWMTQFDKNLQNIPKLFFFDAALFPPSFGNPRRGKKQLKSVKKALLLIH